jgi:hypothetical protein
MRSYLNGSSVGCAWTGFVCLREYERVMGSFEHGKEPSGSQLYVGHPIVTSDIEK